MDIKEDDDDINIEETKIVKSKTLPSIQQEVKQQQDDWGSFNGSFFDTKATLPITNPPPRKSDTSSESLEIISSSSLASPDQSDSQSTLLGSGEDESVEVINKTPSILEMSDLQSPNDDSCSILLSPEDLPQSSSLKSLPEDSIVISTSTLTNSTTESFYDASKEDLDQTLKATIASSLMDKSMESFEIQTQVSSSTHSFEEIKMKNVAKQESSGKTGSGHTSGDELETTTSSDIEIISSPNGDSSSTTNLSPRKSVENFPYQNSESFLVDLKMEIKGHSRELSEVSVLSLASDECGSPSETEKLIKRISELTEVLEQREYKLVQMGRNNAELTEVNSRLSQELKGRTSLDMTNVQEEYTQRLQALEKKFQQSIRDNAQLKKQVESLKADIESKVNREEHEKVITEKDFVIETLKGEGEKMSVEILKHSNNNKKLLAKIKQNSEMLKRNDAQIADLTDENQKQKRALVAKDEIEKSLSEGINKLTTEKRKLEKESQQWKGQHEDLQQKFLALQTSHDALKKELSEKSMEMGKNLEDEKEKALNEGKMLSKELAELREVNRNFEMAASAREQKLRQENLDLKRKLEETEYRIEDQKQEASLASIPLIRQLESLQTTLNTRTSQWENQERILLEKLDEAQDKLASQTDDEKKSRDQVTHLHLKIANLEEKQKAQSLKVEQQVGQLQQKEIEFNLHENDYKLRIEQLGAELSNKSSDIDKLKNLISQLEEKMRHERAEFEEEKRKLLFIQQQHQQSVTVHHPERQDSQDMGNESPVLSLGGSVDSLHSHPWNIVSYIFKA